MKLHGLIVLGASILLVTGCTSLSTGHKGKPPEKMASIPGPTNNAVVPNLVPVPASVPAEVNLESERSALLETDLAFSHMSEEKGAAQAFYDFFAPEGVNLWAGEPPIRGRDAVKVHLAAGPQGFLTWQPTAAEVARSGDIGFTWGTAVFQGKGADEKPRINYSKYVSVWRRQNNGRWKVVLFSTSPSPPPTERRK